MMEIGWTYKVRNEILLRVKQQRNILHEISKRKANWIGLHHALAAHAAASARHTGRQPDSQVQPTHTPINTDSNTTRLSTGHSHFQLDTAQQ
jgi:hypothetical protein